MSVTMYMFSHGVCHTFIVLMYLVILDVPRWLDTKKVAAVEV